MTRDLRILRDPAKLFATADVRVTRGSDGSTIVACPRPLGEFARRTGEWLIRWATEAPHREFLLERSSDSGWRSVTYREAFDEVKRIARWLLSRGASAERPVAILSDNSIEHGLVTLAAMHIGAPAMPISPAYSLQSRDFGKLRAIVGRTPPAVIYFDDHSRYAPALAAIRDQHTASLLAGAASTGHRAIASRFDDLPCDVTEAEVDRAFAALDGDTIAKILHTSGSTDQPKGVINTQRMLCSNQQAKAQVWPFLESCPPVIVDWLPWNHTFGGNHNFNLVLRNGGTLYIDAGRPAPGPFTQTVRNLRDVSPSIYFNVPRGYDMLVEALRADAELRSSFFGKLQLIFYAAASLPEHLRSALDEMCRSTTGGPIPLVSGWGATETAPLATDCHFTADSAGVIGLPIPGCELKLLRNGTKLEVRVRGQLVTPGYWRRPDATAQAFDEQGFYITGDAVRFVDESRPERGLLFDGRVVEDFKLASGTWVSVGALRLRALAALSPVAQDIVVAGHDRDDIGFLIFPNLAACRTRCADLAADVPTEAVLMHPAVRALVATGLGQLRQEFAASSTHAARAVLMAEPPSIDAGEITDKGYINQRAVLSNRQRYVETLYSPSDASVITPD